MNWGIRIIIAFVCFIGVIFTMVYISVNQNISLEAENYYEQELAYEQQMERIKNNNDLAEKPKFQFDRSSRRAALTFPTSISENLKSGKLHFFRPADSRMDRDMEIVLDEKGALEVDLAAFPKGLWKVKIQWEDGSKEYYQEQNLVL